MRPTFRARNRRLFARLLIVIAGATIAACGALALADPPRRGYSPDPAGFASRKQWVFDVDYRDGRASVSRARPVTLQRAATTGRAMGRFAIELYVGAELLDRLRFNVPLTGDDRDPADRPKRPFSRPTFEKLTTHMRVQMADHPRAAWAQIVDRATGEVQRFWWPPEADGKLLPRADAARSDGGTKDAATKGAATKDAGPKDASPNDAATKDAN